MHSLQVPLGPVGTLNPTLVAIHHHRLLVIDGLGGVCCSTLTLTYSLSGEC